MWKVICVVMLGAPDVGNVESNLCGNDWIGLCEPGAPDVGNVDSNLCGNDWIGLCEPGAPDVGNVEVICVVMIGLVCVSQVHQMLLTIRKRLSSWNRKLCSFHLQTCSSLADRKERDYY